MTNRIEEWWCPKPWRAEFRPLERRAGGASTCTMYGPDGEVHPNPGMVIAWDEGAGAALLPGDRHAVDELVHPAVLVALHGRFLVSRRRSLASMSADGPPCETNAS